MRAVAVFLSMTAKRTTYELDLERGGEPKRQVVRLPKDLDRRHDVRVRHIDGFDCYTVTPHNGGTTHTVIYLHGGAYVRETAPQHWQMIARLVDNGARVHVPLYGIAPKYTYREAYKFATEVYRQALADDDSGPVSIVGDSSGGGLALGLTQTLTSVGLPLPKRLVLIAPWVDLALTNPDIPAAEARDPFLRTDNLRAAGRLWSGGDDVSLPRLSPINGPLAPLPATDVYVGTRDLLYPDTLRFAQLATGAGTEVHLSVCEGAVHAYPLVPAPEGRAAASAIVKSLAP